MRIYAFELFHYVGAIAFTFFVLLLLLLPTKTSAQADTKDHIVFGTVLDSEPVSVLKKEGDKSIRSSFCGELLDYLQIEKQNKYAVEDRTLLASERFKRFKIKEADKALNSNSYGVECGAITRTLGRIESIKDSTFTMPFYTSELAFLATEEVRDRILEVNPEKINCNKYTEEEAEKAVADGDLDAEVGKEMNGSNCVRIGVIQGGPDLTTNIFVNRLFPETTVQVSVRYRSEAVKELMLDEDDVSIDAIASDRALLEAILYTEVEEIGIAPENSGFKVYSDSYTEEPYSVLVYDKMDPDLCNEQPCVSVNALSEDINAWLLKPGGLKAKRKIDEYLEKLKKDHFEKKEEIKRQHESSQLTKYILFTLLTISMLALYLRKHWSRIKLAVMNKLSRRIIFYYADYEDVLASEQSGNVIDFQRKSRLRVGEGGNGDWDAKMKGDLDDVARRYADEIAKGASTQTGREFGTAFFGLLSHLIKAMLGTRTKRMTDE